MTKIRIRPISAEEFAPFGELLTARAAPSKMINAGRCERHHALATVERAEDGLDLSHAMVTGGWAWADRFRRQQAALEQDEGVARAQRRGVFRQSDAEPPADFRRRHGPCVAAKR